MYERDISTLEFDIVVPEFNKGRQQLYIHKPQLIIGRPEFKIPTS
jgi:hypothetical protein